MEVPVEVLVWDVSEPSVAPEAVVPDEVVPEAVVPDVVVPGEVVPEVVVLDDVVVVVVVVASVVVVVGLGGGAAEGSVSSGGASGVWGLCASGSSLI